MKKLLLYGVFIALGFFQNVFGQEKEVEKSLLLIEQGKADSSRIALKSLLKKYPSSPSVIYLDAVCTEDGKNSLKKFTEVYDKFPSSKYADAALFRAYSYYYAAGNYEKADLLYKQLKKSYPHSEYIKNEEPALRYKTEKNKTVYKCTIQAGAFINKSNALALKEDLEDAGYIVKIKEKSLAGAILNVVYAGQFINEKEAAAALLKINKDYKLSGRVVPFNQ
jgi:tetratricopeptide (TPR) repeat protein